MTVDPIVDVIYMANTSPTGGNCPIKNELIRDKPVYKVLEDV
jgi:hypothetical protein